MTTKTTMATKTVRTWSEDCYEALQGCFEVTGGPHGDDIDGLTELQTTSINFCVHGIVPARTVHC